MLLGDLVAGFGVTPGGGGSSADTRAAKVRVCDITEDSRTVMPGSMFIARRGRIADGRRYISDAVEAGAVAILTDDRSVTLPAHHPCGPVGLLFTDDVELASAQIAERFYGNPTSKLLLIGITGTNGKTTTSSLIHQMLNTLGVRTGLIGTISIDDGVEVAPAALTTPPALELSLTFARMVEAGCRAAVMEVSSHALDQKRVAALSFRVGVFTNLTGDHLDYHGTMEAYGGAKAKLFAMLPRDGVAIINADDAAHRLMVGAFGGPVLRCCLEEAGACRVNQPECRGRSIKADGSGMVAELSGPWGRSRARLNLIGPHNLMNSLQSAAAVWAASKILLEGGEDTLVLDEAAMSGQLERVKAPPGRLEPVSKPENPVKVYVDYAHTDDALESVLRVARGAAMAEGGQVWCVFGCGGDRDRTKRARMGAVAARLADRVVITSDNPRTEEPGSIIGQIMAGVPAALRVRVLIEVDRARAIKLAVRRAMPGDVVLVAGKGHEEYQILPDGKGGTERRAFDDREVSREALRLRAMYPTRGGAGGVATGAMETEGGGSGYEEQDEAGIATAGVAGNGGGGGGGGELGGADGDNQTPQLPWTETT
ncbi:MAG: UDP-N-acetylmuramoyl-L-alanyl-D-glutamate--2,6-diaminopimelate ligase [Phycisphaerales bacterium]|nr:UDP-N-acetylmuramoyl-L-alanyl-D-glutamate--2,6-diaminopimelate ligase [Phycisphaerales bacterium]